MSAHDPDDSSVFYDVVFSFFPSSTEVHPDCDDFSCSTDSGDSEDAYTSLVFVLGSVSLFFFFWKHHVFWNRLQNQYEDPES